MIINLFSIGQIVAVMQITLLLTEKILMEIMSQRIAVGLRKQNNLETPEMLYFLPMKAVHYAYPNGLGNLELTPQLWHIGFGQDGSHLVCFFPKIR